MASKHTATRELIKLGVFDNLTSFKQFEERSKKLPNTKLVGDYLEILVEGLLYTHPQFNAKNVWQVGHVPARILKKYNFPLHKTMGLDGVYEDQFGQIIPYQVKNYTTDVLSVEHVATFLGVTEKSLQDRVIFTNVPRLAIETTRRIGLRGVTAGFFQSLTKHDFANFHNWLMDQPLLPVQQRTPQPHQKEFRAAGVAHFATHDRGQAVAACGSGKTLSALWIVEDLWRASKLPNNTVIVLLPSISLVSQTRKEWNAQLPKDIVELCVCSDDTAGEEKEDSIKYDLKDMMFPATTDAKIIRKFLKHKTRKLKVIFSTYHSAPVVANAMNVRGVDAIDFGVFDEAHRAASTGSMFSFALSNTNIRINKRMFMTATPKHYKISKDKLAKLGDDIKIVSMDNEKLFGKVFYRLTFKEAVARGIIVPLKVIVSMVTRQEVAEWIEDKTTVTNVKGEDINTKWVAGQISHAQAREKYGINKSISYLSRISQAEEYASDGPRGLKNYVKGLETYCASSKQNSRDRTTVLNAFRDAPVADISNARCLTEGVDLPSVDMVHFFHPRKSHIDIVQAIGRPMRTNKATNKTCGYVLVTLYIDQQKGETFEEAVERTSQDGLVDIINAVREHDEDLTALIQQLRRERGEGKPYNPRILKDKIEIMGPRVRLETLEKSISTVIIDRLSTTFDETYGEFMAFVKKRGRFPKSD